MGKIERHFEQLRHAANGQPAEFARSFQAALLNDFDLTFDYIRTQKLVLKRRSSAWIAAVEELMDQWLPNASLNGKKKSQIKRHLTICYAIQELLEGIDRNASALRIWQGTTESLLRMLFSSIERRSYEDEERSREQAKAAAGPTTRIMKNTEFDRRDSRRFCDYVGHVVDQISRNGIVQSSGITLVDSDIQEALKMSAAVDLVLHILDCYSYKSFRVSVDGKHVRLHGLRSATQQAEEWSTLRASQRQILDMYTRVREVEKARILALSLKCESEPFADFIKGDACKKLWGSLDNARKDLVRTLRRDVEELIDLNFVLEIRSGTFAANQLIEFWAALYQIGTCGMLWQRACKRIESPVLPRGQIVTLAASCLGCELEYADKLLSQFILDPTFKDQDAFFRPLIKLTDTDYLIACTFIETGRFARNLFTIAIREGRVDFSHKGLKPLRDLQRLFVEAKYKVALNLPIRMSGQLLTDVDIAAVKDNFLFLGQTKVLIHPDSLYEEWKALASLKKAALQLKQCLDHISFLCEHFGLAAGRFTVVPFLLTNIWDFTGSTVAGFKIVDFSYLSNLLSGGEIWQVQFTPEPTRRIKKLIEGQYPSGEELAELISSPIHQKMFRPPSLEDRQITIGDWKLTVPIELIDQSSEKKRDAAIAGLAPF